MAFCEKLRALKRHVRTTIGVCSFAFHISEFHATQELHILGNFWEWVEIAMHQYLTGFLTPTGTIRMKKEPNM